MKKVVLTLALGTAVLLFPRSAAYASPWDDVWAAITNLQEQITNIVLTPGPTGPTGPTGPAGAGFEVTSATVYGSASSFGECSNCELMDDNFDPSPGPSVVVEITSGKALVTLTAGIWPSGTPTADGQGRMMFEVTGASSIPPNFTRSLMVRKPTQASATYVVSGLTNGSNTFTAKYSAEFSNVNFTDRSIIVTPL